jgi:hypothetical protein
VQWLCVEVAQHKLPSVKRYCYQFWLLEKNNKLLQCYALLLKEQKDLTLRKDCTRTMLAVDKHHRSSLSLALAPPFCTHETPLLNNTPAAHSSAELPASQAQLQRKADSVYHYCYCYCWCTATPTSSVHKLGGRAAAAAGASAAATTGRQCESLVLL